MIHEMAEAGKFAFAEGALCAPGKGALLWKNEDMVLVTDRNCRLDRVTEADIVTLEATEEPWFSFGTGHEARREGAEGDAALRRGLLRRRLYPELPGEPPLLTPLYELSDYPVVIQSSHYLFAGLVASNATDDDLRRILGREILVVPFSAYASGQLELAAGQFAAYRSEHGLEPRIVVLRNRCVIFAGESFQDAADERDAALARLREVLGKDDTAADEPPAERIDAARIVPAVRMMLSEGAEPRAAAVRSSAVVLEFCSSREAFGRASTPLIPDHVRALGAGPAFVERAADADAQLESCSRAVRAYRESTGRLPSVVMIEGFGAVSAGRSQREADEALDALEDHLKVCRFAGRFSGARRLGTGELEAIVKMYAGDAAGGRISAEPGRVRNRVAIVTGAAQGFGRGIAESLFDEGANVVIVDLNAEKGEAVAAELNARGRGNRAMFAAGNVSELASMQAVAERAVREFGGIDLLVSNAGILRAGGVLEMEPAVFERITAVNYTGFFICVKAVVPVMKLQHRWNPRHFMDIVQINSKSGLAGSNRNFAYAGGKFGGIGLVQSFALELVEDNIKVNAICPGNFFEGPLWSDPETGLFVQYLRAGKVPGARTIEDVKRFYEEKVPMKRGTRVEDVMRALFAIVEQLYETGQAVPVTGGQVMLK